MSRRPPWREPYNRTARLGGKFRHVGPPLRKASPREDASPLPCRGKKPPSMSKRPPDEAVYPHWTLRGRLACLTPNPYEIGHEAPSGPDPGLLPERAPGVVAARRPTRSSCGRFATGEEMAALDELIERKTNPLLKMVYRILNDTEEARDIVQVTFLPPVGEARPFRPALEPQYLDLPYRDQPGYRPAPLAPEPPEEP